MTNNYLINVLDAVRTGDWPNNPDAAFFNAIETLVISGFVKTGKVTDEGMGQLIKHRKVKR